MTPSEIYYALDIVPFFIENVASLLSMAQAYYTPLDVAASKHYSKDCCTFMRTIVGSSQINLLPTPNFLVGTNCYCDIEPKVSEICGRHYNKPDFLIEIPFPEKESDGIEYLALQLERTMKSMAKVAGKKVDIDKLKEVIKKSNTAREYAVKVNELRKGMPAAIRGREAIDYCEWISNLWGLDENIKIHKTLYEELKEKINRGHSAVG